MDDNVGAIPRGFPDTNRLRCQRTWIDKIMQSEWAGTGANLYLESEIFEQGQTHRSAPT